MKAVLLAILITVVGSFSPSASAQAGQTRAELEWLLSSDRWYLDATIVLMDIAEHERASGRFQPGDVVYTFLLPTQLRAELTAVDNAYFAVTAPYYGDQGLWRMAIARREQSGALLDKYAVNVLATAQARNAAYYEVVGTLARGQGEMAVDMIQLRHELTEALNHIHELWYELLLQRLPR